MAFILFHSKIILISWLVLLLILEWSFPFIKTPPKNSINRYFRNLTLGIIVKVLLPMVLVAGVYYLQLLYFYHFKINVAYVIICFLALDCCLYFFHIIVHKNPYLWKIHEIHHLDEKLDATTGLRIHFIEPLAAFIFKLPVMYVLAIPLPVYLGYEILLSLVGIFHHSNLKLPKVINKSLNIIITTPAMHSVHHHALPSDTDSNYGFVFSFWDRLFKTFNSKKREASWQIGLKYAGDQPLLRLLLHPFKRGYLRDYNVTKEKV